MTAEQWGRIQTIFDSVVELPLAERKKALERCVESERDSQVLQEVQRLISHSNRSIFLDSPIPGISALRHSGQARLCDGYIISHRFQVVRFLGRGGMGEV